MSIGLRRERADGVPHIPIVKQPLRHLWEGTLRLATQLIGPLVTRPLELGNVQRILILQLQQLGDSVVFTPVLRALRDRYPKAQIDILCSPVSLELYRKCPYADDLVLLPSSHRLDDVPRFLSVIQQLRRARYDLVVADVTQTATWYGVVAYLTGAKQRLGFVAENRGFLFTTRLRAEIDQSFLTANLQIAYSLGACSPSEAVECFYDDSDVKHVTSLLGQGSARHPLIAVHPASNWQSKTWFPDRWAYIADGLSSEFGASVVFVGSENEARYAEDIIRRMTQPASSLCGQTSLTELAALLAQADLFVGTDSGPRHIAAGVGVQQVTLMSSQDVAERWTFNRPTEVVLRTNPPCSPCFSSYCSHRRCMDEIGEESVLNACRLLLMRAEFKHLATCESVLLADRRDTELSQ